MDLSLQEKQQAHDKSVQRIQELEQNIILWQTAANEKEGTEGQLMQQIQETEKHAQQQREILQGKVEDLEKQLLDLNNQHAILQDTAKEMNVIVYERTEVIKSLELKLEEMDQFLRMRAEEYEQKCVELEQVNREALSEREAADKLVAELNEEVLGLRGDRDNLEIRLSKLLSEHEGTVDGQQLLEANQKIQELKEEAKTKIEKLREQVESMRTKVMEKAQALSDERLDHQADVKALEGKLEEERLHMRTFKEGVKKQFEARQEQVVETIGTLKKRYEGVIKDNEDIHITKTEKMSAELKQGNILILTRLFCSVLLKG